MSANRSSMSSVSFRSGRTISGASTCTDAPRARVIFRSAHARPKYLDTISVDGVKLTQHLRFHEDLARELSRQDRVHTYAGFHICDVPACSSRGLACSLADA